MSTIVTRLGKGSPLTYAEGDANFTNLNNDKTENTAFNAHLASTSAHPAASIPIVDTANYYVATNVEAALAEAYVDVQGAKAYADSLVVGLLDDRGNYDASTNLFPSTGGSGTAGAILKGDLWYITVAGTLGGAFIAVGDTIRALVNSPGQIAGNWATMQKGGLALQYFTEARNVTVPNNVIPAHSFIATGVETDIDFVLSPKGNGALVTAIADNTTVGGNKRGTNALDLQRARTLSTQVASGVLSNILAGSYNTASGQGSACVAGDSNTTSGVGAIAVGNSNTSSGSYSVSVGSANNADGSASLALGSFSAARGITSVGAFSSTRFSVTGDGQTRWAVPLHATTDATPTILTTDNQNPSAANVFVLPDNYAYTAIATITARNTSTGDMASWKIEGAVKRGAGAATTALVGVPAITTIAKDTGASAWVVSMVANTTRGSVEIQVTGVAATNIHWVCKLDTVEVG